MPISRVLATMALAFALAMVFGARGLLHGGQGMSDGMERTVAVSVGQSLVAFAQAARLTAPWDSAERALGRAPDPSSSPLLAAGPPTTGPTATVVPGAAKPTALPTASRPGEGEGMVAPAQVKHHPTPRIPSAAKPLRLLVTGDSLTEFMGPDLINEAPKIGPVNGNTDTHYGTGLVRPDFVDWSVVARQQVATYHPDAVVVMIGGNDFQNMTLANGQIVDDLTPAWTREYQRRAEICMRIWAQGGAARVYWLSMPPARDAAWSRNNANIDLALQRAAKQVRGARYVNILGPVTDHGAYADFVSVHGQPVLVRTTDGIHFTEAGSQIIADELIGVLRHDWKFSGRRR